MVFQHQPLLKFLTHGEHALFEVEARSLLDVIESIANPHADFGEWLSGPFSRQYGAVLAKAIEAGQITVFECMLQGRRWVRPAALPGSADRHRDRSLVFDERIA
jgi:hypothetical protein